MLRTMLLLALAACSSDEAPAVAFSDITITAGSEIPTIQTVAFTTDGDGAGWVSFGPDGEAGWTATATDLGDGRWEATLLGLPADTASWVTVGAGDATGPTATLTTDPAPAWIDVLDSSDGTPTPGFLVVGIEAALAHGAAILDSRGRPVWWFTSPAELLGHLHTRARLSPDRSEVWFNAFSLATPGDPGDGQNAIVRVAIDGSSSEVLELPYSHHDFWLHEDGTLGWLDTEDQVIEGETVRGDRVVERAPDGSERDVWNAWTSLTFDPESPRQPPSWWTLCNHLEYADEAYTLSSRNLDTIFHVDRGSGEVLWSVGYDGTYVTEDHFDGQHGFDLLDDGIFLFDNGLPAQADSRAARYVFEGGTARLTWEYHADPTLYSFVMGDAHLLPNEHALVIYSTMAAVHEVSPAGELVASFNYDLGTIIGFAELHDSLVE